MKVSQTLQSVLCITANKYLVCVLVVLLHARFSVVGPIPFSWPPFSPGSSLLLGYACGQVVMIKTGSLWELIHTYYYGNNTLLVYILKIYQKISQNYKLQCT